MITTGCDVCCFLRKADDGSPVCSLRQLFVVQNDKIVAPGYCRTCRSRKWACTDDLEELHKRVSEELVLKFDLLIFFDEKINTVADLERTLNSNWYTQHAKNVVIMDVTGFGNRQNLAFQYIKSRKHEIPTTVDSSVKHESVQDRAKTVRRIFRQVKSPFFLAIPAGKVVANFDRFANMISKLPSRAIHWSFPYFMGNTAIIPDSLDTGMFISRTYRSLVESSEQGSFEDQLRKEEKEMKMGLSWFSSDCYLV